MGIFCAITGLLLTTIGTVLAAIALLQDWRDHAGGEPLVPVLARLKRWFVRRVLRRPPGKHVVGAGVALSWGVAASAKGYAAPPSNAPVDVQMRFVRERLLALEARIGEERREIDQRIDKVQTAAQEADARSQTAIAEVEAKVREVATGSVRMELVGLVLVGFGSIVSTLPAVFS
ncbi:hypothetical protein GCM10009789_54160 [Kribbella sancticallisti]|uniref:Uncharacterized protein n=2 Tax=Kribbella sancticallisti TaxID=460087 RepID=A0ABN2E1G5_9ACTN